MKVLHRDLSFLGTKGLGYEKSVRPVEPDASEVISEAWFYVAT